VTLAGISLTIHPTCLSRGGSTIFRLPASACAEKGKANAINKNNPAMLFAIDRIDNGFRFFKVSPAIDVKCAEPPQFLIADTMLPLVLKK